MMNIPNTDNDQTDSREPIKDESVVAILLAMPELLADELEHLTTEEKAQLFAQD